MSLHYIHEGFLKPRSAQNDDKSLVTRAKQQCLIVCSANKQNQGKV
jgi:hypothetical protein